MPPPTVLEVVDGIGVVVEELEVDVVEGVGAEVELELVVVVVDPASVVVDARLVLVTVVEGVAVEVVDADVLVDVVALTMVVVVDPPGPDTVHVTPDTAWNSPSEASMTVHL